MKKLLLIVLLFIFCLNFIFAEYYGEVDTYFSTGGYECVRDASSAYWQNPSDPINKIMIYNSSYTNSFGICNNSMYSDTWCCPFGLVCMNGSCSTGTGGHPIISCSDIEGNNSCNNAPYDLAIDLIEGFGNDYTGICNSEEQYIPFSDAYGNLCANFTLCGCFWNDSLNSGAGACSSNLRYQTECSNGVRANVSCSWTETSRTDHCGDELKKITIHYDASGSLGELGDLCVGQDKDYPCSVSVKLPFFDKFSFIFSGLAIALVYFVMRRK